MLLADSFLRVSGFGIRLRGWPRKTRLGAFSQNASWKLLLSGVLLFNVYLCVYLSELLSRGLTLEGAQAGFTLTVSLFSHSVLVACLVRSQWVHVYRDVPTPRG